MGWEKILEESKERVGKRTKRVGRWVSCDGKEVRVGKEKKGTGKSD